MPRTHTYASRPVYLTIRSRARRKRAAQLIEALEPRQLMAATLFVTPASTPVDATHFQTLQTALAAASDGDTIDLLPGFSAGNFATTTLNGSSAIGDSAIRTVAAVDVSEVISIGSGTVGDPVEQDLVTSVTPTLLGDFLVTLASPLQFAHSGSPVDATNPGNGGPTIGINKGVTLTTDGGATIDVPFNLEVWSGTTGVSISPSIVTPNDQTSPPPPPPPTEAITITTNTFTLTQGQAIKGPWATFTDSVAHKAKDFTATVTFADGTVETARVRKADGGTDFAVLARHRFTLADTESFTVSVSDSAATASAVGSLTINPRVLAAQGVDSSTTKSSVCNLVVATFTDTVAPPHLHYKVTIAWSDGVTTTGEVDGNCGSSTLSVKTSRDLSGPATLTGVVIITTDDGLVSTTADFTLTVTAPPPPTSGSGKGGSCQNGDNGKSKH